MKSQHLHHSNAGPSPDLTNWLVTEVRSVGPQVKNTEMVVFVVKNLLAVLASFPYLTAAGFKELITSKIKYNAPIERDMQSSLYFLRRRISVYTQSDAGHCPASDLQKDASAFQALQAYAESIFSTPILPFYSDVTKKYLMTMLEGFSSFLPAKRMAAMVSYELNMQVAAEKVLRLMQDSIPTHCDGIKYTVDAFPELLCHDLEEEIEGMISSEDYPAFLKELKGYNKISQEWYSVVIAGNNAMLCDARRLYWV